MRPIGRGDGRELRARSPSGQSRSITGPLRYPIETFTDAERRSLEPHFTNLDRPVFALTNLPETVKGALFARYSRYQGTLRRLYLDEFAADAPTGERPFDGSEGARAAQLYERIFLGYGDDSVAQLGGAHLACEWVSNVLTKALQRGRLAAYLEQSTRYIAYDAPMEAGVEPGSPGSWRYWRGEQLGDEFTAAMDEIFTIYSSSLRTVRAWAEERWPRGEEPEAAWRRSINAKALDLLRGLLPAATLSHVGIYASGQAYEQLLLRLASSPLPEAREVGAMALEELRAVIPSFLTRVDIPERGGEWVSYLEQRRTDTERWVARLGLDRRGGADVPSVELVHVDGTEEDLIASSLFEASGVPSRRSRGPCERWIRSSATRWSPTSSAPEPTVVTDPAAAGNRSATASRSSPTTAGSATCSGTGCSPASGSRSHRTSVPECPRRSLMPAPETTTPERSRSPSGSSTGSRKPEWRRRRPTRSAWGSGSVTCST